MDGNVGSSRQVPTLSITSYQLDLIMAACDVEGNFMVIKVRFPPLKNLLYFSDDQVTSRPTNTLTSFHACSSMRASTLFSSHKVTPYPGSLDGRSPCACSFLGCTCVRNTTGHNFLVSSSAFAVSVCSLYPIS